MAMSKKEAEAIISLIPVATALTGKLVEVVKSLNESGYDIPDIDDLEKMNEKLKSLDDLAD